jgi:hypothetical protein
MNVNIRYHSKLGGCEFTHVVLLPRYVPKPRVCTEYTYSPELRLPAAITSQLLMS